MSATPNETFAPDHHIVAIGASAGGLEAIHQFFDHMPLHPAVSFVVIQHLSPDHKSLLVELLAKHTKMKVLEAAHDAVVEKGCVYVIPSKKLMRIADGRLQLTEKATDRSPNTAIDIFFKSLATDRGQAGIGVILSGTGTDGTRGAEAIQQAGGVMLVQEPSTAKFDGMPNSAINAGFADFILSPDAMPAAINSLVQDRPDESPFNGPVDERGLSDVLLLIEKHCGLDFYQYKPPTLVRRIMRRMHHLKYNDFKSYLKFLNSSKEECSLLGKDFLIGVTRFFRDEAAYEILQKEVFPEIFRAKEDGDTIKVWVAACSTGQEAYSMAIAVSEAVKLTGKNLDFKIFATDIDSEAVEVAARGRYNEALVTDIDSFLLQRYFHKDGGTWVVNADLRKHIVFARHNILKDPPFIKNDLISCRNMLIYMNSSLQRKVFSTLQYSLNKNGFLFLGPSEVPGSISSILTEISPKWKIYQKTGNQNFYNAGSYDINSSRSARPEGRSMQASVSSELAEEFKNILTEEFRFAGIYVDANYDIKEAVGDFRAYLTLPQKIMNLNLLKMVEPDLAVALNAALRQSQKEGRKISLNNVRIKQGERDRYVDLFIKAGGINGYIAVVFGEAQQLQARLQAQPLPPAGSAENIAYITNLEEELKDARLNLQVAVESLETTNEQLQSSNEELLSANEELQSSNEELQSLNEELHTLNAEHQLRIKELIELNDDLNNYFRSSAIAQIFLDSTSRIRKFNPAAVQMINLIETDIGRPVDHISTNLKINHLPQQIKEVQESGKPFEREIELTNGGVYLMRILPYLRQEGGADGVVISFVDLTEFKELDSIIKGVFNTSPNAIAVFKLVQEEGRAALRWVTGNAPALQLSQQDAAEETTLVDLFPQFAAQGLEQKLLQVLTSGEILNMELSLQAEERQQWFHATAHTLSTGVVLTLSDTTEQKEGELKLRKNYAELLQARNHLKDLAQNLEAKVVERTAALTAGEERMRLIAKATSDVIWDRNLLANEVWWSDDFYRLFDVTDSGGVVRNAQWLACMHPDDADRVWRSLSAAIDAGGEWECTYRMRTTEGRYVTVADKGAVILNESGMPYRMVGAFTDVSELERAEQDLKVKNDELQNLFEEFRFVTDFMPQMVWATLPDGYHNFYNKRWYEYTGLTYEESKAEGWNHVLHPDDQQRAFTVWSHCLNTGAPYEIEYRFRRHDGEYRWFLGRALPLRNEEGAVLKWFGTCTDIHDQKLISEVLEQKVQERTQELQRTNRELEATNAELQQFASVASHDLKEPLRKIHIFGAMIKERYMQEAEPAAIATMDKILTASTRMSRLISDLLAYSRLSVSNFFENVSLNNIIGDVLHDLEMAVNEKGAVINCEQMPQVEAVPGQMRQLFQNLLSNALKFIAPGETPHITISCRELLDKAFDAKPQKSGPYIEIKVHDNGIGFEEQYNSKIFTIFQRLHTQDKYEGTGIGLAICKKIVEKHNGLIAVNSKPGVGTVFTIILPVRQQSEELLWQQQAQMYN